MNIEDRMKDIEFERDVMMANIATAIKYNLPQDVLNAARDYHKELCMEYRILKSQYIKEVSER